MKYVLFGILLFLLGVGTFWFAQKRKAEAEQAYILDEIALQHLTNASEIAKQIDKSSKENLWKLKAAIRMLPEEDQEELMPLVDLRIAIITFNEGESYLDEAAAMHNTLGEKNGKLHPIVNRLLDAAIRKYEECKNIVDNLGEIDGINDYNFDLNYTKGEIYFRYLQLMGTPETANALFKNTVNFFKFALRYKPRDINTVVNIELLIKKQYQFSGGNPDLQKRQMLNNRPAGVGGSKGN